MKSFLKVVTAFIVVFGLTLIICNYYNVLDIIAFRMVQIALGLFLIIMAYIIRHDNNVSFFSSLDKTMFESDEDIARFLNAFLKESISIARLLIVAGFVLLVVPIFNSLVFIDIIVVVYAVIKYVLMYYRLSIKFTK